MSEGIDWKELWKLPEDVKKKIVKGKTPHSKKEGEISEWIGRALNRLETHEEMRKIARQISPSTQYKEFNSAIRIYLTTNKKIKDKILDGEIHILDLLKENPESLSKEDKKNLSRYKKAKELQGHLILFYKDLGFFLEGTKEDRTYLRQFLKPQKIHYLAQLLSCIRNEDLLETLLKHEGIKPWETL